MNTIRFTSKEAFIEALEGRRKFWRDRDKQHEREHKSAEQDWLKDTKRRLGRSPDNADALLAFYSPNDGSGFFDALLAQQQSDGRPPPMVAAIQAEQQKGNA